MRNRTAAWCGGFCLRRCSAPIPIPYLRCPWSVCVAAGETFFTLESDARGLRQIGIGDAAVPTQADGSLWVHYSPPDRDRYVSAVDLLEGRDDPALTAQKIVLLGVTGLGLVDQQVTSRGDRMPGIEIHAQVLENIFENSCCAARPGRALAEALAFALMAAVIVIGVLRVPPRRSVVIPLVCWTLLAASGLGAYYWGRVLFDPGTLIWGINLLYGIMVSATLVAIDLERRELAARLATEREAAARVAGELGAAHRIQTRMLPNPATVLAAEQRIEIYADMRPAREVGGDLYDFFPLADDRLFLLVGDVAGKGLPAAMFMAVSKALAKSSTLRESIGLENLMAVVNTEISRDNPEDLFVTLIALIIDLNTGRFDYCNAGHEPPLLVGHDGHTRILNDGGGPPMCVMPDFPYEIASAVCAPGDLIVLTSDGITGSHGSRRQPLWARSPASVAAVARVVRLRRRGNRQGTTRGRAHVRSGRRTVRRPDPADRAVAATCNLTHADFYAAIARFRHFIRRRHQQLPLAASPATLMRGAAMPRSTSISFTRCARWSDNASLI